MRAFRRHTHLGFFVLLAFALQVALAFAQTHAHTHSAVSMRDLAARAITYGMCLPGEECPTPAHHDEHGCQTCASASLASSAVLPGPPALATPVPFGPPALQAARSATIRATVSAPFDARAPPRRLG
jgi:Family of unknown function (DUF6153)